MRFKWYVWLLAALPALVVILATLTGVLDSKFLSQRASIVLSGLTITFVALALLAVTSLPWRIGNGWRRTVALGATGLSVLAAAIFGSMGFDAIQQELFVAEVKGVRSVAVVDSGLVAVGTDDDGHIALWLSGDGESWDRADHSEPLAGVDVRDVAAFDGQILVIGLALDTGQGVVLTSSDGLSWSRRPVAAGNLNSDAAIEMTRLLEDLATTAAWEPEGIAAVSDSLVMVGDTYGNAVVFWHSKDSVTWNIAKPMPVFDTGNRIIDVVAWEHGFVAVGFDGGGEPQIWTSETGAAWTIQDTQLEGRSLFAAAADDVVVVVANSDSGAMVWTTTDGVAWTLQDSRAFLGRTVDAITASASGFTATGLEPSAGERSLWASPDGQDWTLTSNQSLAGSAEIHDIVPFGVSFVAVGYDNARDTAAFWIIDARSVWRRIPTETAVASAD